MAYSQSSCPTARVPYKKPGGTRRVWTQPEELALIDALKELCANGWRAENGFRPGYSAQLELIMGQKFPHGRPMTEKHINSKLTVWKKTFGPLHAMFNCSGFGFHASTMMVDQPSDDIWNAYAKQHPEVSTFCYKSFPYYEAWCEIFGNDRADGKAAQTFNDAVLDLESPHEVYDEVFDVHVVNGAKGKGKNAGTYESKGLERDADLVDPFEFQDISSTAKDQGASSQHKATSGKSNEKKRKARELITLPEQLVTLIGSIFEKSDARLGDMAEKVITSSTSSQAANAPGPAAPSSPPNKSKLVFNAVADLGVMPLQLRIMVAHKIAINSQSTYFFLGMDSQCRFAYVDMVITGQLDPSSGTAFTSNGQ